MKSSTNFYFYYLCWYFTCGVLRSTCSTFFSCQWLLLRVRLCRPGMREWMFLSLVASKCELIIGEGVLCLIDYHLVCYDRRRWEKWSCKSVDWSWLPSRIPHGTVRAATAVVECSSPSRTPATADTPAEGFLRVSTLRGDSSVVPHSMKLRFHFQGLFFVLTACRNHRS